MSIDFRSTDPFLMAFRPIHAPPIWVKEGTVVDVIPGREDGDHKSRGGNAFLSLSLSRLLTIAKVHSVLIRGYIIMHTYVYIIPGHLVGDPVMFKIRELTLNLICTP